MNDLGQPDRILARFRLARYLLFAAVVVLAGRFWSIQVLQGRKYALLAEQNRVRVERERAPRGLVIGGAGEVLASSEPSFTLVADAEGLVQLEEIGRLDVAPEDLPELRARAARAPTAVRSPISFEEAAFLQARRRELTGVSVDVVPERRYPLGPATAHLLGYVGEINATQLKLLEEFEGMRAGQRVGQAGIERVYNRALTGTDGFFNFLVNAQERALRVLDETAPVRGETLRLSVVAALQAAAFEAFEDHSGAFVMLDVKNGAVLGLGSFPTFDPHEIRLDPDVWSRLRSDPRSPLLNRTVQSGYPPGSTFKLVTAAAALAEGAATPDTAFTCNGRARVAGRTFRCHRESGHGTLSMRQAIAQSCNVYFYRLATRLDIDTIARYARALGLGAPTGVDTRHETAGMVPDRAWKRRVFDDRWYDSETASVAVGQGPLVVTPIQMARLASAFASSGALRTPRIEATGVRPGPGPTRAPGIAPEVFEVIRDGMRQVVESGTGWRARLRDVAVSGKTGTAQVASMDRVAEDNAARPREYRTHAWFVGFAPSEAPEVAIAVIVEHSGGGGTYAAPVAARVLRAYFDLPAGWRSGNATVVAGR